MKKTLIVFLTAVLAMSMLFVSCSNEAKIDSSPVKINFSSAINRGLTASQSTPAIEDLYWYYKANKTVGSVGEEINLGATDDWTRVTTGDAKGLDRAIEFAQGRWDFELQGRKTTEESTVIYQGSISNVLILKDGNTVNTITVPVSQLTDGSGTVIISKDIIVKKNLSDESGYKPTHYKYKATTAETYGADTALEKKEGALVNTTIPLDAGTYDFVVMYKGTDTDSLTGVETPIIYASSPVTVTVSANIETLITGSLEVITAPGQFDVEVVGSKATASVGSSTAGEVSVVVPIAPSEEQGADTTVTFEAGAIPSDATKVVTEVKTVEEAQAANFSVSTGKTAVAAIDLKITDDSGNVKTVTNGKTVTVTTYILKGLSQDSLNLIYTGNMVEGMSHSVTDYEPETGKLVFQTNHFSEFFVESDAVCYVIETNTAYNELQKAINDVLSGQTVALLKDVKLTNPTSDNCIQIKETMTLDGNDYRIYCEDSTLPANARLVNITGVSDKDITIKNITIESANYGTWMRGLNLYQVDNINLNIVDSVIQIPHYYALNIATECTNTTISIDSTTIRGWATIYNHSSGVTLTANNSTFDSVNPTLGGGDTNSFGNVVVAEYYDWAGSGDSTENNFIFNNCKFTADKLHPESDVKQVVCDVRSPNHNSVAFNDCTFEDLSTPQYLKVAIDTVSEDDLDTRRRMLRTSHIYIDGNEITEENDILNSYIDWDFDEDKEDGIMDLCNNTYIINPIPYLDGEIISSSENTCTVKMEKFPDNIYTFSSTRSTDDSGKEIWTLTCEKSILTWKDKLIADYAALTDEESEITLSGEYVLDDDIVLEWPSENVKSITINGGDGLSITGQGKLCFKYPESVSNVDDYTINIGSANIYSYFDNISIG